MCKYGIVSSFTCCFSALQRAENSSIVLSRSVSRKTASSFSALQRAENSSMRGVDTAVEIFLRFSALQRAENSSIPVDDCRCWLGLSFQCSSASRKFLNGFSNRYGVWCWLRFSALQRAENSSMARARLAARVRHFVSVLFSEPKIPQSYAPADRRAR